MNPTNDFEQVIFNTSLLSNPTDDFDPDLNYFNDLNLVTSYIFQNEVKNYLNYNKQNNLSILHLNIRSIRKNFESFRELLETTDDSFNIICLTETWSKDLEFKTNSLFHLQQYNSIHSERKSKKKGGGLLIYIKNDLIYKVRNDLSVSDDDRESLTIEIINKTSKNILVSCCYKPPNGNTRSFNKHLENIYNISSNEKKLLFILGDFNINCLNYNSDNIVNEFYNGAFSHGIIPLINRPTRVTTKSCTLIDNILTNCLYERKFVKGIIKSDLTDHFPIFVSFENSPEKIESSFVRKRIFSDSSIETFKSLLRNESWNVLDNFENVQDSYNYFLNTFQMIYNKCFPIKEFKYKQKDLKSPWISKGIKKSSKLKQKLYIKFLKNKTPVTEEVYKTYKSLFEKIKRKAKTNYYKNKITRNKDDPKKTWDVMKEITGKCKITTNNLPKMLQIGDQCIYEEKEIAEQLNDFFTNVGPNLANKIPDTSRSFKYYLKNTDNTINNDEISFEEFENAFKNLKKNKAPGIDEITTNIVLSVYDEIKFPLFKIFRLSFSTGVFPDKLKIAKVSPVFKSGDCSLLGNYRPISVLPVFSKVLERILYNRLYDYLVSNNLLFNKRFGFQKNVSTEHAILQLVNEITDSFNNGNYTNWNIY